MDWNPDVTPTVSLLELVWVVLALLGCVRTLLRAIQIAGRRRALRLMGINGLQRLYARSRYIGSLGQFLIFEAFFWAGALALLSPPGPANAPGDPTGPAISVLFILVEVFALVTPELVEADIRAMHRLAELRTGADAVGHMR